jgi:hypothetical protein
MKMLPRIGVGALLAAVSVTVFAQVIDPYAPKTRAQVRAELAEWIAAGFDPMDEIDYPMNAQRAGRIVAQRRALQQPNATTGQ